MTNVWPTKTLGEIADVRGGKRVPKGYKLQTEPTDHPYITVSNFTDDGTIDTSGLRYVSQEVFEQIKRYTISSKDLYLSIAGTIGKTGYVPDELDGANLTENACKLVLHPGTSRDFLYYFTKSSDFADQAGANTRTAAQPKLALERLKTIKLCIPPLPEQKRIVAILDEAFASLATAKANAAKNLQNARALFESHLDAVFSQRSEGWIFKRLDEVCTFSSGGTPSKSKSSYWSGKIPWISGRDMKSTRLSDSLLHISKSAVEESSTRMAAAGTLLILVRGMGLAHGAQIAELTAPCAFNQDIKGIHADSSLIPRYLLFALRDRINSSDTVLSNAAHGTLKIDTSELQKLMIPIPPLKNQKKLVDTIDSLSEETLRLESIYEQKLAALDELKQSLLHKAFSGEL